MSIRGPQRRPRVVPITAPSFPTLPRPQVYRKIVYTFVALTIIVLIGVLWLSSVRADVTVRVKQDKVRLNESVEIARAPRSGQIPGYVVQGVFEKIQQFDSKALVVTAVSSTDALPVPPPTSTSSTTSSVPDDMLQARGTVRIINKYSKSQTLVKTTRLLTSDKKLYRIDKTIVVPAGGEVSVGAYADQNGSVYAIGPTKFTIPGLFVDLQKYIYAVSDVAFVPVTATAPSPKPTTKPEPSKPTTSKTGTTVTADMIAQAQKQVMDVILTQAKQSLAAEVKDPKFSQVLYTVKVLEKKTNATVGQSTDQFLASAKLDVTAVYYSKEDMAALITSKLKDRIPDGRELTPFNSDMIEYSLELTDAKAETASVHAASELGYHLTASSPSLQKSLIAGKSKDDAIALLKVEGVDDVEIVLHPGWMSKLPTLKDHINLKIE